METRIFRLVLLSFVVLGVDSLTVTIPKDEYEFARGDNATLPCTFQSIFSNPPRVIITWSVEGLEANADEKVIATYYSSDALLDVREDYKGKVSIDVTLSTGKANLKIRSVTLADNKNFECRVQIPGDTEGTLFGSTRLVVLVAPSTPVCAIQGKAQYGQNINLTCHSEEGSPTPRYEWTSLSTQRTPHVKDPRTTSQGGILSLFNITRETSGYYNCTSSNKIRSASCNITLAVMPPSMNVGATAGIIAGVVAALIILAVVIYCCCCRKKKEDDQQYEMGPDKATDKTGPLSSADRRIDDDDESSVRAPLRDRYEERRDESPRRDPDGRRSDRDDRRSDYDDRRSDYDDRRSDYDDRRSDHDNRRGDYADRRKDYDDRRRDYDDRRRDYDDRHGDYSRDKHGDRYGDENERGSERYREDDRYDEPYDDRERSPHGRDE
ncbi:cell surface A33 antigen-like [Stigmatopora nigra]